MLNVFSRRKKTLPVRVTTMDADITAINIEPDWTGRQLFDAVCRIIGLREIWYFGLQFINKNNISIWLQMERPSVPRDANDTYHFYFLVKFYPESVEEELIQDITRHLFFLQIKQNILREELYCQAEAAVLLASYAIQATSGDANDMIPMEMDKLLPASVISHYQMTAEMWEDKVRKWWNNNAGQSTEEAEMEYLRVAQDLVMYGIQYYPIYNQKDTNLLLGVSAQGIGIYETHNRLSPRPFFPWSDIKNISFKNKEFTICNVDKSKLKFRAQEMSINMSILDLCIGTHNLYLRRRQPDPLEVQQMKVQAKEQREKREAEQAKLQKERTRRIQAEHERDKYKNEAAFLSEQLVRAQEMARSSDESYRQAAEKLEQETLAYSKRASEAEAEVQRVKLSKMPDRLDSYTPLLINPNTLDMAERLNRGLFRSQVYINEQNAPPYAAEATNLANPLRHSHTGMHRITQTPDAAFQPQQAHPEEPRALSRTTSNGPAVSTTPLPPSYHNGIPISGDSAKVVNDDSAVANNNVPIAPYVDRELQELYDEIERSRAEGSEKNRQLRERLAQFRREIQSLKKQESITEHDRIHAANVQMGLDKYSTLRKSCAGPPRQRVEAFDEI